MSDVIAETNVEIKTSKKSSKKTTTKKSKKGEKENVEFQEVTSRRESQISQSGEFTKAMNKDWHSGHFCCWKCDEALTVRDTC